MKNLKLAPLCCLLLLTFVFSFQAKSIEPLERCATPSVKNAIKNSEAIFVGKVLSVSQDGDIKTFEFQVEKYWKGRIKKKIKINVQEFARFQAWFKIGGRYLVYANSREDGKLFDGRCSATKLLSDASKDLKQLGKAKNPNR